MPEGDTIARTARTLERVLVGKRVVGFETPRLPPTGRRLAGSPTVVSVKARGKHLLITFADGTVLHTHMQMRGSWHVYRPGERWRVPPSAVRVTIEVEDAVAVCARAPVVDVLGEREILRHPQLASLGPDLCAPGPDLDAAVDRLHLLVPRDTEIGVALLDQRVASGIGNVYKNEVLFARRIDPFAAVGALDRRTCRGLFETASALLRANLEGRTPRRTVPEGLAVYRRSGGPCRRCGTPIHSRKQGEAARVTYWCPTCQPSIVQRPAS